MSKIALSPEFRPSCPAPAPTAGAALPAGDMRCEIRDLVWRLGGLRTVARAVGCTPQAVANWYRTGIPQRHHLTVWRLAHAAGLPWRPPGADGLALAPAGLPAAQDAAA
jgi:hypothetical protein